MFVIRQLQIVLHNLKAFKNTFPFLYLNNSKTEWNVSRKMYGAVTINVNSENLIDIL
jgi:hypothetical protein